MAVNYESAVINGQLVPVAPAQAFSPLTFGSVYSGPGYWPRGGQWNVPPLLPSAAGTYGSSEYSPDMSGAGGVTAPTSGGMSASGKVNWLHPTKSPVLWVIGLLGASLFLLHKVHYGK